jgi:hypothetical protein
LIEGGLDMRRTIACVVVAALLLVAWTPVAHAGTSTDVALGLASFAVFNQVVGSFLRPHPVETYRPYHHRHIVYRPVVAPPRVIYASPAPVVTGAPYPAVIQYPHGRYELQLHGYQYVWVWIPSVPTVPPPPPAPPHYER